VTREVVGHGGDPSRHNLDEIAFCAPPTADQATLDYFMSDYVDHLEHHLRQIVFAGGPRGGKGL
jgi:hypothetical protein